MAHPIQRFLVNLNPLVCHDEGDGIGDAEPYLWTVFFKCDGASLMVSDAGLLEGSALVFPTPGSHGNLNNDDVDAGDTVVIPSELGSFGDFVRPIPIAPSIQSLLGVEDLPGFFGAVVVLMEEDNVTDAGAEAGHQALNAAVQTAIERVLRSLGAFHQEITPEDIDSVTAGIDDAVKDAIREQQGVFANIWSWLNADDQIGHRTFLFNQDAFVTEAQPNQRTGTLGFSERWRSEGDWEIRGAMALTDACPALAAASIVGGRAAASRYVGGPVEKFGKQLAAMRAFRDRELHRYDGLKDWWDLVARNTPRLAYLCVLDSEMRKAVAGLFEGIDGVLRDLDAPLPARFVDHAKSATRLASESGMRRLRLDASRFESVLRLLKRGSTARDVLTLLSTRSSGRDPRKVRTAPTSRKGRRPRLTYSSSKS